MRPLAYRHVAPSEAGPSRGCVYVELHNQTTMCDCDVCNSCSTCGTPWNVGDQAEWKSDWLWNKVKAGDSDAIRIVKDYWKAHVHEWIDELDNDIDETIFKSLREVAANMQDDVSLFHCEDCNDSSTGRRCFRNRERCSKGHKRKQPESD